MVEVPPPTPAMLLAKLRMWFRFPNFPPAIHGDSVSWREYELLERQSDVRNTAMVSSLKLLPSAYFEFQALLSFSRVGQSSEAAGDDVTSGVR
jgi:hypothetical protein